MAEFASHKTALLADPIYREHDTGPGHPEQPLRFDAVVEALDRGGLTPELLRLDPRAATEDEIALCHGRGYIEEVHLEIRSGTHGFSTWELSTGDTVVSERSLEERSVHVFGCIFDEEGVICVKYLSLFVETVFVVGVGCVCLYHVWAFYIYIVIAAVGWILCRHGGKCCHCGLGGDDGMCVCR